MVKTVTDRMLRQAFNQITKNNTRSISSSGNFNDENVIRSIQEKIVTKVNGSTMICSDGTEAELLSPAPCIYWKCLASADEDGTAVLVNPIGALIVTSDQVNYCLGLLGTNDEFEVRCQIGKNEIRINKNFINISANHLVVNGVEVKKEGEENSS